MQRAFSALLGLCLSGMISCASAERSDRHEVETAAGEVVVAASPARDAIDARGAQIEVDARTAGDARMAPGATGGAALGSRCEAIRSGARSVQPTDPGDLLFYVNRWAAIPSNFPVSSTSIWTPCDPGDPGIAHDLVCMPASYTYRGREALREVAFESDAPAEPATTFDGLPIGHHGKVGFKAMLDAARDDGHLLLVRSAFRSYAMQSATFSMWVAQEVASGRSREFALKKVSASSARAGHSEHQLGTTADLVFRTPQGTIYDGWDAEKMEASAPIQWVMKNAHRFGIVLTYDKDRVHVTQYVGEPWHYRFVGVTAANAMKECDLSTEEYLQARYGTGPLPPFEPHMSRSARR